MLQKFSLPFCRSLFHLLTFLSAILIQHPTALGQLLRSEALFSAESFWDNQDFDWYARHIPLFECPDKEITTTYYYRWDLLTKHLTYGSPSSGYSFTEFMDRPYWSGAYGAISCPAGFQLYEARWLRSPVIANDYSRYWFRTNGAQPRNYSSWLADSVVAVDKVHPNQKLLLDLLPDLITNYEGWEKRHFVPEVGLFWQTGHDDGMELNINSRQTQDIVRGAPCYRPSFNSYMWADAKAIAHIASLADKPEIALQFNAKADSLKAKMMELLWDEKRQFFFPVFKSDEERDGHLIKAMTRTYESGQFAGDSHGRELIGYVPWQFNLFQGDSRFDIAWKKLMDRDGFYADYGPSTVERNDPMFLLHKSCCVWSGQSWPFATTQTLKGLANHLQGGGRQLNGNDYIDLLSIFSRSHRKDGKPYLAEALHPDTGSFEGHDSYNHSEHYFHSGFCDLIITGLIGIVPRHDDSLEIRPLAPADWSYFAMDNVPYRGHLLSIAWDKDGSRYGLGPGLHLMVDGKKVSTTPNLSGIVLEGVVPLIAPASDPNQSVPVNFAVNNDGHLFPRMTASFTADGTSLARVNDGNYWYLRHPPNRWTTELSPNEQDRIEIDLGVSREVHTVKLFVLDDRNLTDSNVRAPKQIKLEFWDGKTWQPVPAVHEKPAPFGHRPHEFNFKPLKVQKLRVELEHDAPFRSGLSEIEVWGELDQPYEAVSLPPGNLAHNNGRDEFPKATASHHDRFGGVPKSAVDGITSFLPSPNNRWTSYESENPTDWLEIDFGKSVEFRRVDLAIYDDRGGVQAPVKYEFEYWDGNAWKRIPDLKTSPLKPEGGQWNSASFEPVTSNKFRLVFTHSGNSRSGVTEVMVWNE